MRIFLSSTFADLAEHRAAVFKALQELTWVDTEKPEIVRQEDFGLSAQPAIETLLQQVKSSNWFVLLVGSRYGYVPEGQSKSVVELEYEAAKEADERMRL